MIKFKHPQTFVPQFEQLDSRLKHIIYGLSGFVAQEFSKDIIVTSVYRDQEGSTHKHWRAIDLRVKQTGEAIYTFEELKRIEKFLDNYIYDPSRPLKKTYLIHGDNNQLHLHLQVVGGNKTLLVS